MNAIMDKWEKEDFNVKDYGKFKELMMKKKGANPIAEFCKQGKETIIADKRYEFEARTWHLNTLKGFELAYHFINETKLPITLSLRYTRIENYRFMKRGGSTNGIAESNYIN